jgi:hypothetical protein
MKSFKQHLKEFAIKSTSDLAFEVGSQGQASSALKIPISGPMFKRIWPETIRATVFHVTDHNGLGKLKRLEGGKKSISAFFSMMSRYMETGVATSGGAVVEMDADLLVSARDDIMSQVDKTGRRWVEMSWFENQTRNRSGFAAIERELNVLIRGLVIKHLAPIMGQTEVRSALEFYLWADMKKHLKGDGKKLRLVIKDYFDGVERIIKKNKDVMGSIFYGYAKSKRMTDNSWDEQIVNNIKVKKVHLIKPSQSKIDTANPDRTHPIDSYEFAKEKAEKLFGTVKEWDASIDLEIYTREVVKKEQPPRNIAY